jgi:phage repressor protein C with HTH and peptisase S24 domain
MFEPHNLLEIRKLIGMSQADFAMELKMTRESVNKIERGKSPISKRTVLRLKTLLEKYSLNEFSHDVNILGKASQKSLKPVHQPYYLQRREQKNIENTFLVPLVAIKAQAGYVKGYEQVDYMDALEKYSLPPGVNPTGAVWRYFEIDGDSMEPTFSAADIVLATMVPAEDWHDIKNFSVYIILTNDQLLIKRLYRKSDTEWVMISDNEEAYPQVLLKVNDVKQLWLFRRHIRSRVPQPKEFKITA